MLKNSDGDTLWCFAKLNPDGKTVAAMDVLVPNIGELVGGSQREDDFEVQNGHPIKDLSKRHIHNDMV